MLEASNNNELPVIPGKRYFTIGEVSELCGVKSHVLRYWEQEFSQLKPVKRLRYWEQEFSQLKPVKRRGNRRYYQRHDVILIRQIRSLLYDQGYTIGGARLKLTGEDVADDNSQSQQIIRQMRDELEGLLAILK
jgi:DNA-binding transcriptional MerR regulator